MIAMHQGLVKHVLFPLHERLKGKRTFFWLRELERTQWFDRERLEAYQFARMRRHLEFAYAHVPYYRALLDEHGVPPTRIHSHDDFRRIPFLTRDILRDRFEDLRATVKLRNVQRCSTGGSTGMPVTVEVDMERAGMAEAARLRAHRWFGIEPGAREVVLWGSPIELGRQDFLRNVRDWLLNSTLLSAFDMGESALARYARVITRVRPQKMYGYASAFALLARYFQREGLEAPVGLKAVFTTAEPLFGFQRELIQSVFGCPVSVEYGCRDGGLVALECPAGGFHVFCEGMYVEIADPDEEGRGEIVLTCLDSFAFPIIRYRTGDIGSLDPAPCPCGRGLSKLKAVEGRRTDFLVTPKGRVLHALSAIYVLRDSPVVREFRVVQESLDRVVVQLVANWPLARKEEAQLRRKLGLLLGPETNVEIVEMQTLPRSASGKFRYVESRVAEDVIDRVMRKAG